jgi:hypothetical protein
VKAKFAIPQELYDRLRRRAESSRTSMRSLILRAIEKTYAEPKKDERVSGPPDRTEGKVGLGIQPQYGIV